MRRKFPWLPPGVLVGAIIAGCPIPASAAKIPFVRHDIVDVGAEGRQFLFVRSIDMDQDGDRDVLTVSRDPDREIAWWEDRNGDATVWVEHLVAHIDTIDPVRVDAGDIDVDGDLDVAASLEGTWEILWWENTDGVGHTWFERTIDDSHADPREICLADVDGDTDLDVVAGSSWAEHVLEWWENESGDGGSWTKRNIESELLRIVRYPQGCDVDGDGDTDVVAATSTGGFDDGVYWWENVGGAGTGWQRHTVADPYEPVVSALPVDMDLDGDCDLLCNASLASEGIREMRWFENAVILGRRVFWPLEVDAAFAGARSVAAGDLDGDGDPDLAGAALTDNTVAIWMNGGGDPPTWTRRNLSTSFAGAIDVQLYDVDMDADLDVVAAGLHAGQIRWWDNKYGDATGWNQHILDTALPAARSICVADLDRDGDPDLASAADGSSDEIALWPNRGGQFKLATGSYGVSKVGNAKTILPFLIVFQHNGRSGDSDAELAALEMLFEESAGDPLTEAQLNGVVDEILVYRDDGDGFPDAGDVLVGTYSGFSPVGGTVTLPFADGDPDVAVDAARAAFYFVMLTTTPTANQAGVAQFIVTHLTESSSSAEDREYDLPLTMEYVANVSTSPIEIEGALTAPVITLITRTGPDSVRIEWTGLGPGTDYTVLYRPDDPWSTLWITAPGTWPIAATSWTDGVIGPAASRFYKVKAQR